MGGLGVDTDVKYTMQESERIKGKITNILNGSSDQRLEEKEP